MPFGDIVGRDREKEILKRAMATGRVAHAYLFAGPSGTGKRSLAFEFARALNCSVAEGDACGACRSCLSAAAGGHPNIMETGPEDRDGEKDPKGLIRIGAVRRLQERLRLRAAGYKVAVVDDADRLMPQAANAFLKTLEEPPEATVIILVTSKPRALLATILSRCQKINFGPLSFEAVRDFLADKKGLSPEDAAFIARLGSGSIASSLALTERGLVETRKETLEKLAALDGGDTVGLMDLALEFSRRGDLEEILEFLKTWCRDRAALSLGAEKVVLNSDLIDYMKEGTVDALADAFDMIERTRREISPPFYANRRLAMEALLLSLAKKGVLV